ncbi:hypothetical protein TNCV_1786521 [Trichonephila clavipes]|nr:hypothetical protein TNCV_1786521 [Trichonephila clavipes]
MEGDKKLVNDAYHKRSQYSPVKTIAGFENTKRCQSIVKLSRERDEALIAAKALVPWPIGPSLLPMSKSETCSNRFHIPR